MGKASVLFDTFHRIEYPRWKNWDGLRTIVNNELAITVTNAYPALVSQGSFDLTSSAAFVSVTQTPNIGNGTTQMFFNVSLDNNNSYSFNWNNANLGLRETVAGANNETQIPYNATNHRWWRIREAAGTVYWEGSPDGKTWNVLRSKAYATAAPTNVTFALGAGYYGTEPTPGVAKFGDFNRVGEPVLKPDTGWSLGNVTKGVVPSTAVLFEENWSGTTVNTANWDIITYPKGYVNNELQNYAASALTVSNNLLRIRATNNGDGSWTSGRLHLSAANYFRYGYIEARVKFPAFQGCWPSFWILGNPSGSWPLVGEFDTVEVINAEPRIYTTLHGALNDGNNTHYEVKAAEVAYDQSQWHTYGVDMRPGRITTYLDGVNIGSLTPADIPANGKWPFDTYNYFCVLNFAVGGDFPGPPDGTTPNTMDMFVGRVRVYA